MKSVFFVYCLLFTVYCSSCSNSNSGSAEKKIKDDSLKVSAPAYDNSFEKGKVIVKIRCTQDSSLSYGLYLPKSYSSDKKIPVIYCFDSHASGPLPLEKYKGLAEKYGYILAGSNNSKNGMSWEQNEPQIKIFMDDVKQRLNIDAKRIYACGFSGGSRVASSVAIFDGGINCVIGMGAGFPSISDAIRNHFDYIGFAGNEDFNMNEMIGLIASMDKSPIRHELILFNGKHEWAPAESVEDAFVWLEINAMKDGLISKNDSLIKNFVVKNENALKGFETRKDIYNEQFQCSKIVNYLDGLADVSLYKKKVEELNNSDEFKKITAKKADQAKEELSLQENYKKSFVLKDFAWWTGEIKKLQQTSKNKSDEGKAQMNKRVLSYLSLLAYMNAKSAFEAKQYELEETFLTIYQMVDPENSEHQYMFADLYAIKKDNTKALSSLKNAVKLGFNDLARMEADPALSPLKSSPEYNKLLQEVKSK